MLTPKLPTWPILPRDTRDTLFLLVVIAWLLLPQTAHLPLWCSVGAGVVLLWRGVLALKTKPLPRKIWLLLILSLTIAATYATHHTLLGRDAGVTLLAVLLTLKTLELRARRDAFVVFFLGFFCMLSNFFYSQSLLTALSMVIGLLGLLTALVNAHMPVGQPPLMQAAKTAGGMALLGTPIMLVLFMLFPRMAPLWGVPSDAMTGRSGLGGSMEIGHIAKLALNDNIAMRLRFEGQAPPQRDLYFRGPVLSNFDGRSWQPRTANLPSSSSLPFTLPATLQVKGTPTRYEVTLEPTQQSWVFVLDAALQSPELAGYSVNMQSDLQWLANQPLTDLVRYKATSYLHFQHGPMQAAPGLQEFLELPADFNPRTLDLAHQIRNHPRHTQANASTLVQAALNHLRTGGYRYTLEPGLYGKHSADEFWFDRKEGFCEHIASSFVILMRAMNIPARIVTGYQGGEFNRVDGFWVIRQSDAHAWAEVWQAGLGWVRVDPTSAVAPGRTGDLHQLAPRKDFAGEILGTLSPTLTAQLRAVWEAANNGWNQWVLNYTQSKQFDLLKEIGFESPSWQDLSHLMMGVMVFSALVGGGWALWERTQHDPWLRLLGQARQRLAKAGIASTPTTSPRQLVLQVRAHYAHNAHETHHQDDPAQAQQIQALCDWLIQLEIQRYAPRTNNATRQHEQLARLQQLQQLKQQWSRLTWPT